MAMSSWFLASQVQPEPKLATAWAENSLRKASTEPHLEQMTSLSLPSGSDLLGEMQCQ